MLREALGSVAHDLGGLASALALRADAMGPAAGEHDLSALRAIADELRALGRQLRHLRGPRGLESLAPPSPLRRSTWWAVVERVGTAVLGRGIALHGDGDELNLTPEQGHALTYLILALMGDLRSRGLGAPAVVTVTTRGAASSSGAGPVVTIRAEGPAGEMPSLTGPGSGWVQYAERIALAVGANLAWDSTARATCRFPPFAAEA